MKHLILIGPPAAGKGTVSSRLVKENGFYQLSTGDLLREVAESGTEFGNKIASLINDGKMASNEDTLRLMKENLPTDQPIIFDGYPRNVEQANLLKDELLPAIGSSIQESVVVVFNIDLEKLIKRVVNRRTCTNKECGKIHHLIDIPPVEKDGKLFCTDCGAEVSHRKDDTEDKFPNRIDVYKNSTAPIIELYKESAPNFFEINADTKMEEVYAQVMEALK